MSTDGLRRRVALLADEDLKRFRTLQAEAARRGFELHALAAGGFLLARWDRTRELDSLAEVEALLSKMEGRP